MTPSLVPLDSMLLVDISLMCRMLTLQFARWLGGKLHRPRDDSSGAGQGVVRYRSEPN